MNRGEGLKIAARAKHSTLGFFQEDKKIKKKQFGYKSRSQSYAVRKVETNTDNKDIGKQPNTKEDSQNVISSAKQQKNTLMETRGGQRDRPGAATKSVGSKGLHKKPINDFVKKNKTLIGSSGGGIKAPGVGGKNTITLTQEQLNAILQSIGAASAGSTVPAIAIENGSVTVDTPAATEAEPEKDQQRHKDVDKETKKGDDDRTMAASGNVLGLLQQLEDEDNSRQTEVSSKLTAFTKTLDSLQEDTSQNKEFVWGNSMGMGNIGAIVGSQSSLTLQERKKQEWKKALDEQLAEQTKRKEHEDMLRKSLDGNGMFHRQMTHPQAEKYTPSPSKNKSTPANDVVIPAESFLGHVARQSFVPAAMRSNFIIGDSASQRTDDYNVNLKRKEQQEWIQEIERQKRETADRKDAEKKRGKLEQMAVHWGDPVMATSRAEPGRPQDVINTKQTPRGEPPSTLTLSRSIDITSPTESGEQLSSPRSAGHTLTDPAEVERRQIARKKHLEHMRAIQEQVEEKQRTKREAEDRRRREEAEEERKLTQEREALQKQFDIESEKQRKKEEAATAKQKVMEESILNAQQEALAAKQAKRLNKHGHDFTNLRMSWDANHVTETSPRQVVHSSQKLVQHSPPPVNSLESYQHVTNRESPGGKRDVGTSTISEQSTQTGFDYSHHEVLSPRRQASAGIEYKERIEHKDTKEQGRPKHVSRSTKTEREVEQAPNRKASKPERIEETEKQKEQKTEKPRWGQNATKKKISNSERDLSKVGKGREERRRKRQEELLAQQERLTRRRNGSKKRAAPLSNNETVHAEIMAPSSGRVSGDPSRDNSRLEAISGRVPGDPSRDNSRLEAVANKSQARGETVPSRVISRESPSTVTDGDFYPFLRSDDVKLNNRSVRVTPISREGSFQAQQTYFNTNTYSPPPQMDPLLNPERLKDNSLRQERILEQLSHLRQGLMMKQREVELGLSPTMMM